VSARPEFAPIRRLAVAPPAEDPAFRRFLAGDAETIRAAARTVASIVRFRAYFIPAGERADLEQDTLLHLWRAIGAPGFSFCNSFDGLVRSIAYRRCIDWRRTRRAISPLGCEPLDPAESADRRLLREESEDLGRRIIDRMRGPCRELFRLHAVEGLGYGEIAAIQGRSETALRTQMSACLKEARAALARLREAGGEREGPRGRLA
jgi:RNA polymerase sigma factor (sigma-70 family)